MSDIMTRCPICKQLPTIGIDAVTDKHSVACMNICCPNMKQFLHENQGFAMVMWNKWANGRVKHIKDSTELSGGHLW